jgi:hypothetical protein
MHAVFDGFRLERGREKQEINHGGVRERFRKAGR